MSSIDMRIIDSSAKFTPGTVSGSSMITELDKEKNHGWKTDSKTLFEPDSVTARREVLNDAEEKEDDKRLTKSRTMTLLGGKIKLRGIEDDDPTDWWFASTAIPLLAAAFAPMANMLSIAALVVYWRNDVTTPDDPATKYSLSVGIRDPQWCLNLNGTSLACGFIGNIFLLCNFTRKIRYIVALPVTILLFYLAAGMLTGCLVGIYVYDPATEGQVYSQGFWTAVIAACLYMGNAMLLMINMLGYFRGHYPQHFDINDEQRNLILQAMIFYFWLAAGAAVFAKIESWDYSDALYFGVVTTLTIGFGDFHCSTTAGRALVFPFTVFGIITLGLLINSLHKFAQEISKEKVVKQHIEARRVRTLKRAGTVQSGPSTPLQETKSVPLDAPKTLGGMDEQINLDHSRQRTIDFNMLPKEKPGSAPEQSSFKQNQDSRGLLGFSLEKVISLRQRTSILIPSRRQKVLLMHSERAKFMKMRSIQSAAKRFKSWYALSMSIVAFGLLWCIGALVFWQLEYETQGMTYFTSLYFCYVSLLTIGYGDQSPLSAAGRPFFVFWALIAVPIMTILVSDLGDTAIGGFKRKVLDYGGLAFLGKGRGWGVDWFTERREDFQRRLSVVGISLEEGHKLETRHEHGSHGKRNKAESGNGGEENHLPRTIEELAREEFNESRLTEQLAYALQQVANDMKHSPSKQYSYEMWVEFTRLIRFSRLDTSKLLEEDEAMHGLVEWDWLDSDSPMTSEQNEPEWVMDRLLESLLRTFKKRDIEARLVMANASADNCGKFKGPPEQSASRSTVLDVENDRENKEPS
ncbi:Potassium channel [Lithohypha guttulata]|uniref:Potassium channel n=1 Tax=Lithohypha guttulata TaxID=1690604 RepID=UPI002DDEF845|nr:Potassium channel [Lithohypha guttulata]